MGRVGGSLRVTGYGWQGGSILGVTDSGAGDRRHTAGEPELSLAQAGQ